VSQHRAGKMPSLEHVRAPPATKQAPCETHRGLTIRSAPAKVLAQISMPQTAVWPKPSAVDILSLLETLESRSSYTRVAGQRGSYNESPGITQEQAEEPTRSSLREGLKSML
jgi:hypothetical protein